MFSLETALCPTDFSEPSDEAIRIAGELGSQVGAGLLLVHVVPVLPALPNDPNYVFKVPEYERPLHKDADDKLAQLVRKKTKGTTTRTMVGHGDVADDRAHRRRRKGGPDHDCYPRDNRLAAVHVWFGCGEGVAPSQVPGAHDTEPAGGEGLAGMWHSKV
jgi:hypothetical protein